MARILLSPQVRTQVDSTARAFPSGGCDIALKRFQVFETNR
jgi:hypothetical protein